MFSIFQDGSEATCLVSRAETKMPRVAANNWGTATHSPPLGTAAPDLFDRGLPADYHKRLIHTAPAKSDTNPKRERGRTKYHFCPRLRFGLVWAPFENNTTRTRTLEVIR